MPYPLGQVPVKALLCFDWNWICKSSALDCEMEHGLVCPRGPQAPPWLFQGPPGCCPRSRPNSSWGPGARTGPANLGSPTSPGGWVLLASGSWKGCLFPSESLFTVKPNPGWSPPSMDCGLRLCGVSGVRSSRPFTPFLLCGSQFHSPTVHTVLKIVTVGLMVGVPGSRGAAGCHPWTGCERSPLVGANPRACSPSSLGAGQLGLDPGPVMLFGWVDSACCPWGPVPTPCLWFGPLASACRFMVPAA